MRTSTLPPGLDPIRHPIIARHWFGWRSVGEVEVGIVAGVKFRRDVERLHDLGPRPLFEFLSEMVDANPTIAGDLERRLDRYAALDPGVVDALDAREMMRPIAMVAGGRR